MYQPAELLAHDAWLRPMVRSLVAAHDVDDVLQDTWLAAFRRPPVGGLRAWLPTVARNFALLQRRRTVRRQGRETLAAPAEATASTAETVQKLGLQAAVAKAVAELAEPYREAVILRFHDGLGYASIARSQGVSVANARQRVSRGLTRLRQRLGEEAGPGWQRSSAVAMLIRAPRPLVPLSTGLVGVWIMKKSIGVAIAALLVLGTLVFVARPFSAGSELPRTDAPSSPMRSTPSLADVASSEANESEPRREVVPVATTPADTPEFRGLVLDPSARRVAGVEVVAAVVPEAVFQRIVETEDVGNFEPEIVPVGISDAEGRFSVTPDGRLGRMGVSAPYAMLRGPDDLPTWNAEDEILMIVAPAANVEGVVSDPDGVPLAGVVIDVAVPDLVDFPLPLDPTERAEFEGARTEGDGRFSLSELPGGYSRLTFYKPAYRRATLAVAAGSATESIVLAPLEEGRFSLVGTVSDPRGQPVADAAVGIGSVRTLTDRFGSYQLELDDEALGRTRQLYATKAGMQTWLRANPRSLFASSPEAELDIRMAGEALALGGRVVDPDGVPMRGIHVILWEEAAVFGGQTAADLALDDGGPAPRGSRPRVYASTDADGAFVLGGLQDKDYRLRMRDGDTWLAWTEGPFRAGRRDLQLTAPVESVLPELRGQVLGRDGQPVAGVEVSFSVQVRNTPPSNSWSGPDEKAATTGADGEFRFTDVPIADDILLVASGEDVVVHLSYFSPQEVLDGVVLEVDRRCQFRVELTRPGGFTHIRLLDERDEQVSIWEHHGGSNTSHRSYPITDGRTPVIAAGEQARTLVFLGADREELARMPIRLVPGQVNLLQR